MKNIYIFDEVCEKTPYIVPALYMMLTQNGLGKDRVKYSSFDMLINDVLKMKL